MSHTKCKHFIYLIINNTAKTSVAVISLYYFYSVCIYPTAFIGLKIYFHMFFSVNVREVMTTVMFEKDKRLS